MRNLNRDIILFWLRLRHIQSAKKAIVYRLSIGWCLFSDLHAPKSWIAGNGTKFLEISSSTRHPEIKAF